MNSLFFQITSIFYVLLIIAVYFSKKRVDTIENRIYISLLIINLLNLIVDIASVYMGIKFPNLLFTSFLCKLYLVFIIMWVFTFTYYIFVISSPRNYVHIYDRENINYFKKTFFALLIIFIFAALCIFILPLDLYSNGILMYTYGSSAIFSYVTTAFCILVWVICMIFNIKSIKDKKYLPVFAFIILAGGSSIIQMTFPQILLVTSAASFITVLTFFTIENPDIKMIEQLNLAKEQSEKANKAKTEFLSSMSHEIRTPLNAIVGFSQTLVEDETVPENVKEEVRDIVTASDNLLEIVNGILDISKIEANKLEIINTEYNLNSILKELVVLTKTRIGEKNVEIKTNFDEDIPYLLYGDQLRIKQIILNLLTNAAKYTKEGFIFFRVNVVKKDNICRIIVSVEDTGIGIKTEKIDKLFTKFERLGVEKDNTVEGTGLGLAITKKLVELMNGKIVVQSKYGEGSKFTVAIDQRIVSENPVQIKEDKKIETEIKDFTGKKILVVDDNQLNLKVASLLLKKYGVTIDTANSGFECIDKINDGNYYDLVLLDDMMPRMSGVETLKRLKEDENYKIPTIALTANAISGMKEKYLNDGFDDYLSKPIEKNELDRVINKFL